MPRNFFFFICHFPSVEDGSGGIYLSGQSSNPANRRHLRIDPPPASADLLPSSGPVVSGKVARLRFGKAAAPKNAPVPVKRYGRRINFGQNRIATGAGTNHLRITVTIVPARSPMSWLRPV